MISSYLHGFLIFGDQVWIMNFVQKLEIFFSDNTHSTSLVTTGTGILNYDASGTCLVLYWLTPLKPQCGQLLSCWLSNCFILNILCAWWSVLLRRVEHLPGGEGEGILAKMQVGGAILQNFTVTLHLQRPRIVGNSNLGLVCQQQCSGSAWIWNFCLDLDPEL